MAGLAGLEGRLVVHRRHRAVVGMAGVVGEHRSGPKVEVPVTVGRSYEAGHAECREAELHIHRGADQGQGSAGRREVRVVELRTRRREVVALDGSLAEEEPLDGSLAEEAPLVDNLVEEEEGSGLVAEGTDYGTGDLVRSLGVAGIVGRTPGLSQSWQLAGPQLETREEEAREW